jgi:hypothetical protein
MEYIGNNFSEELMAYFPFTTILLFDISIKEISIYA